jgi:chromosome transmission fidelity protein 8
MPSISLHTTPLSSSTKTTNPLPSLLQTPFGLAILEIQGTIHAPFPSPTAYTESTSPPSQTSIGRLEFPLYNPEIAEDGKWMKKVYLYIGKHQRLTGEVKKLPKAMAVIRKRDRSSQHQDGMDEANDEREGGRQGEEELEIAEIVKYKILFAGRPEPVGGEGE